MTEHASDVRLDAVAAELGVAVPESLRALYREQDGWWDDRAQYWVVWPLERLVEDNRMRWDAGTLPAELLAFGDDGAGGPFCMAPAVDAGEVIRWSAIDDEAEGRWTTLDAFRSEWCPPAP